MTDKALEKKVTKRSNPALLFETLAVSTIAAMTKDFFSTQLFKVKYILLEAGKQQMVPGVNQRK